MTSLAIAPCSQGCNTHASYMLQSGMPFSDALAAEAKALWKLDFKQSRFHHIAQVLRRSNHSVKIVHRFMGMLLSPLSFDFRLAHRPQAYSLKCRPTISGIPQCATWRTCAFACGTRAFPACARVARAKPRSSPPLPLEMTFFCLPCDLCSIFHTAGSTSAYPSRSMTALAS